MSIADVGETFVSVAAVVLSVIFAALVAVAGCYPPGGDC